MTRESKLPHLSNPWPWVYALAAAFAAGLVWLVGHRGVFLLDQSILFDGAWRVYQGQVPYRDFVSAFPPIPFLIQSLFFRLTDVDFSATVLAAAVLNAAAALCVVWLVRHLVPGVPFVALLAGLLTAVWFQAPFGTLWFEQTAFFFNLLALVLLVKCLDSPPSTGVAYRVTAGVLLAASMLCKQNAGGEFVPFALGAAAIPMLDEKRKAARAMLDVLAGLLLGAVIFALWLWVYSVPAQFWKYYVEMARQIGSDRVGFIGILLVFFPLSMTWPFVIVALGLFASGFSKSRTASMPAARRTFIIWIVVGCAFYQNLFKLHTDNEVENAVPFLGLIYGLSFAIFWKYAVLAETPKTEWGKRAIFACLGILALGYPLYSGLNNAWNRNVQEFQTGATFDERVQVPKMSRVMWGEPTRYGERSTIARADFEGLNAWLAEMNVNFFVFPDSTMLYGLQGRVSPQPWLYFSPGHSFLTEEILEVDAGVLDSLQNNDVQVIVLEKDSWVLNHRLWTRMPKLRAWIEGDFEKVKDFGIYEVRRKMQGKEFSP